MTYAIAGTVRLTATYSGAAAEIWEFNVFSVHSSTTPIINQTYATTVTETVIDQVRLSSSSGVGVQLDIHLAISNPTLLCISFEGIFTTVANPVVGATVLPTGSNSLCI